MRQAPVRFTLILILILIAASSAQALSERSIGGDRDSGFFLRLSAGFGFAGTEAVVPLGEITTQELSFTGSAADLNLAVGGFVRPGLALHLTLMGWTIDEPSVDYGGLTITIPNDLSMTAIGGGITWYVLPSGLYLSASLGLGELNIEDAESESGLAMDLTLGKEWWVSKQWSLGLAGGMGIHNIPEPGLADDWQGASFSLRFSASMR